MLKRTLSSLVLLALVALPSASITTSVAATSIMTLPATDTFNGGTITSPVSGSWTMQTQNWEYETSTTAAPTHASSGYAAMYWNADAFSADQYSEIVLGPSFTDQMGPAVRMTGTGNVEGYWLFCRPSGSSTLIENASGGSYTPLLTVGSVAWATGDTARIEVSGTTITVYRNGTSIGSTTSSAHSSGSSGLVALADGGGGNQIDNWTGGNMGGGAAVTVTTPTAYHTYQRSGTTGSIAISGTVSGIADGQHIEASFNGGSYSSLGAIASGAFSGTLTSQAQGQGTLTVRHTEVTTDSTTIATVGIGDVYVCIGDSIDQGRLTNAKTTTANGGGIIATAYHSGWGADNDPTNAGTSTGSFWPLVGTAVVTATSSFPVAFINVGLGSSALVWTGASGGLWPKGNANYTAMASAITAAGLGNPPKGFLVHLGANDSIDSSTESESTYQTAAAQLVSDLRSDYPGATVFWAQLGDVTTGSPPDRRAALDNIREAIRQVWNTVTGAAAGPVLYDLTPDDGVHYMSDASATIVANRWAADIVEKFYGGSAGSGRGPTVTAMSINSGKTVITVTFNVPTSPITPSSTIGGFRVYDGGTVTGSTVTVARPDSTHMTLTMSPALSGTATVSLGSGLDVADNGGSPLTSPKDSSSLALPNEAFIQQAVSVPGTGIPLRMLLGVGRR